jgi:hypothetical protein
VSIGEEGRIILRNERRYTGRVVGITAMCLTAMVAFVVGLWFEFGFARGIGGIVALVVLELAGIALLIVSAVEASRWQERGRRWVSERRSERRNPGFVMTADPHDAPWWQVAEAIERVASELLQVTRDDGRGREAV